MAMTSPAVSGSVFPKGVAALVLCVASCGVVQSMSSWDQSGRTGIEIARGFHSRKESGEPSSVSSSSGRIFPFVSPDQGQYPDEVPGRQDFRNEDSERLLPAVSAFDREESWEEGTQNSLSTQPDSASSVDTPLAWMAVELQRFCQADQLQTFADQQTLDIYEEDQEVSETLSGLLRDSMPSLQHIDRSTRLTITLWARVPDAEHWRQAVLRAEELGRELSVEVDQFPRLTLRTDARIWPWSDRPCPTATLTWGSLSRIEP